MNDQPPLHRLFRHYSELPYSLRVLFTATLLIFGLGYLFALTNIYFTYAGRAGGNPRLLTYEDIVVAFSGSGKGSVIQGALQGPMSTMLPPDQRAVILNWVRDGATRQAYETKVQPILHQRCMQCHDGSNPHLPNLSNYDGVKKVTAIDTGASIANLVLLSHIHLFGMTFIFFMMGLMFSHAYVRPVWFKCTVIALPFLSIVLDVGSWYLIKLYQPFAALVILAGALMAACFAIMWVVTLYQMWFSKPPEPVLQRLGGDIPIYG